MAITTNISTTRIFGPFLDGIQSRLKVHAQHRKLRVDCFHLLAMNDHSLSDMGLNRNDIRAMMRRSKPSQNF